MSDHQKRASEAERLLNDPAFIGATEAVDALTIRQLRQTQLDGKPETERYVLELVRTIQAGARYQRLLWEHINAGKIAEDQMERRTALNRRGL